MTTRLQHQTALIKTQKAHHRRAFGAQRLMTPEQRALYVAESIILREDEGRAWTWAEYGLAEHAAQRTLVESALARLRGAAPNLAQAARTRYHRELLHGMARLLYAHQAYLEDAQRSLAQMTTAVQHIDALLAQLKGATV